MKIPIQIFKYVSIVILSLLGQAVWAGTATMTGYGEITAPAEFVAVTVVIKSECFPSAVAVSSSNDAIANRALQLLRTYADPANKDEISATGGFVERYTAYRPKDAQPICVQQFRKQNQLTFKTHTLSTFAETFAALQDGLYSLGMATQSDGIDRPTSFLEISIPVAGIESATLRSLERKALSYALQDAKEKFQMTLALAGIGYYKIMSYTESSQLPRPLTDHFSSMKSGAQSPAPVEFLPLKVTKLLNVEFQFEGGSLNIPASSP